VRASAVCDQGGGYADTVGVSRAINAAVAAAALTPVALAGSGAPGALAATAPTCTPARLNNSALLAGAVTASPMPGSRDASPHTQISFVGAPAAQLRVTSVVGSRSGAHRGRLEPYSQGDGASFVPAKPFVEGERVTVRASLRRGASSVGLLDRFAIGNADAVSKTPEAARPVGSAGVQSFVSRPDLQPPAVTVTAQSSAVATGDMFVAPYSGPGQNGPMILEPSGAMIWFKPLPPHVSATNLQVQQWGGQPVLTWWQGTITGHGFGLGEDVIANSAYTEIAHVHAGNGLRSDLHEFELSPRATALITAYEPELCNLAAAGGSSNAAATDGVLQEIDVNTGLVRFQWTSLDHVALSDSYEQARKASTEWPFDFFHINSINRDQDGSLLVSARNTWAAYDIDARSGQIEWQLGGKRSSFAMGAGATTAWQHDSRMQPNGTISMFDNGASPRVHGQSRGVVVSVNAQNKAASLAAQFERPVPIVAESQGNLQALANGDWFAGWGQVADFSEFSATGQLLFDAHFPTHVQSYRAFRFAWQGTPAEPPQFVVSKGSFDTLYASWNGATSVASWRVLTGPSGGTLQPVAQALRSGFETALALPLGTNGVITVQALDANGAVIGTAAPQTLAG
jgi:Arylsulfotransferase (ASST)